MGGQCNFHLRPAKAVLADLNPDLVNTFRMVRNKPRPLMDALDYHSRFRNDEAYFYKVRSWNPWSLSPVERAARTIFLNKTCFNGLYRVNAKGGFNVPWGGYKNPTLYDRENILAASALLQGSTIRLANYLRTCQHARSGDFVYFESTVPSS